MHSNGRYKHMLGQGLPRTSEPSAAIMHRGTSTGDVNLSSHDHHDTAEFGYAERENFFDVHMEFP